MRDSIGSVFGVAEPVRGDGSEFALLKSLHRWWEPSEPMKSLNQLGACFNDTALRAEPCKTLATCTAGAEGARVIEIPRAMWRAAHAMEAVKALNDLPHFRQLPTALLQEVASDMTLRRVPYRGFVAKEAAPAKHLFLIKSGQVKTEKLEYLEQLPEAKLEIGESPKMIPPHERRKPRKRHREMMVLGPGNSFEERNPSQDGIGVYPCSLVANSENVVVWELPRSSLERLHKTGDVKGRSIDHFNTSQVYAAQAAASDLVEARAEKAAEPIKSMMALPDTTPEEEKDLGWKLPNFRGIPRPGSGEISFEKVPLKPFKGQFPKVTEAPPDLNQPGMPPHKRAALLEAALPELQEEEELRIAFPVLKLVETSGAPIAPRPKLEHPLDPVPWQHLCEGDPSAMPAVFGGKMSRSYSKKGRNHQEHRASQMREIMRKINPDLGFPFRSKHETQPQGSSVTAHDIAHHSDSYVPEETVQSRRKFVNEWRSGGRLVTSGKQTIVRMERDHSLSAERIAEMERSLQANLDNLGKGKQSESKKQHRGNSTFPDIQRSRSSIMTRPVFGGGKARGAASRSVTVASRYS